VLLPDGTKSYLRATKADADLYAQAEQELHSRAHAYPIAKIAPGYNTNQALGYNYRFWHEMFNARQLLGLSILGDRIRQITDLALRELFTCLFSGTLEFNNMFASYKGEGTGAVRHMFSHHILKPERTPLEANLWGTPKSSGSFSTLFQSRILRALDYAADPFELQPVNLNGKKTTKKIFGLSAPIGNGPTTDSRNFLNGASTHLSCGDSSVTEIDSKSIDAVITDPPFFDNVHYSELADFFHVWQRHILGQEGPFADSSTRSANEVQTSDSSEFTGRLTKVWSECHRVLRDEGLLVFTYHHSRAEGWAAVLRALMDARFSIVAAHPIKSEMSVAMPKHQAKEPIDLDIILVCRKRDGTARQPPRTNMIENALGTASDQLARLRYSNRSLSRNDIRIVVMAQLIRELSQYLCTDEAIAFLETQNDVVEAAILGLSDQ
jgi:adenine-specific DNA methylase